MHSGNETGATFARFAAALLRVHGEFIPAGSDEAARVAVVKALQDRSVDSVVLWDDPLFEETGLAAALEAAGIHAQGPGPEAASQAASAGAGLTTAMAGLEASGSIVVHAGPGRPRCFSLLPPLHVALLPASLLLTGTRDLPALYRSLDAQPSAMHVITGPSSTGDIELVKVHGVHGPMELVVVGLIER